MQKEIVYSATRSGSKRFRVARFTARDEVECCKRNDESLILPRSSRGSYFPQYTNDRKWSSAHYFPPLVVFFMFSTRSFFRGEYVTSTLFYMQWKLCFSFTYWGKFIYLPTCHTYVLLAIKFRRGIFPNFIGEKSYKFDISEIQSDRRGTREMSSVIFKFQGKIFFVRWGGGRGDEKNPYLLNGKNGGNFWVFLTNWELFLWSK